LQQELIKTQEGEQRKYVEPSTSERAALGLYYKEQKAKNQVFKQWKVGEKCMAKDSTNGQYYEATIESMTEDGDCQVIFDAYQNRGQANVKDLKEYKVRVEVFPNNNKRPKANRPNQKEYLKKKKQKKQQRMAELEEEREKEKNKWLQFTSKSSKKQLNKTQSIFQSPSSVNGRVGIGTLKTNSDAPLVNNFRHSTVLDSHKRKM
jgi:survival of motor neuron-related-splicing factor 30